MTIEIRKPSQMSYPWEAPHEVARRLDSERVGPVTMPTGERMWMVCGYAEAQQVLSDPRFSRGAAADRDLAGTPTRRIRSAVEPRDSASHLRLRRVLAPAFTPRRARELTPWIKSTADTLVARVSAAGPPADLVSTVTRPLPMATTAHLLGIDVSVFEELADPMDVLFGIERAEAADISQALERMVGAVGDLISARRARPDNSLLSHLVTVSDADSLPGMHLHDLVRSQMMVGWQETSRRIANSLLVLLQNPDQLTLLERRPDLLPNAVEELLRYDPHPASSLPPRLATEDVEVAGTRIPREGGVIVSPFAANRDPQVFHDPDRLDITRSCAGHLAFGYGQHFCPGAHLARVMMREALGAVLTLPHLELTTAPDRLDLRQGWTTESLRHLPVTWSGQRRVPPPARP